MNPTEANPGPFFSSKSQFLEVVCGVCGSKGDSRVVVDSIADKYYVIMPDLPLSEATFDVEDN